MYRAIATRGASWHAPPYESHVVLACMPTPHAYKRTAYWHVACWHAGAVEEKEGGKGCVCDFCGMYMVLAFMPTPHAYKRTAYWHVCGAGMHANTTCIQTHYLPASGMLACWCCRGRGRKGVCVCDFSGMYVVLACMSTPHAYKRTAFCHVTC